MRNNKSKPKHNKKHLVYSDGKTLIFDNHCDECKKHAEKENNMTNETWNEKFDREIPMLLEPKEERWFKSFISSEIENARKEATNTEFNRWIDTVKDRIGLAVKMARKEVLDEVIKLLQNHADTNTAILWILNYLMKM